VRGEIDANILHPGGAGKELLIKPDTGGAPYAVDCDIDLPGMVCVPHIPTERADIKPFFLVRRNARLFPDSLQIEITEALAADEEEDAPAAVAAEDMRSVFNHFTDCVPLGKAQEAVVAYEGPHDQYLNER
jgi:hypothetical protein